MGCGFWWFSMVIWWVDLVVLFIYVFNKIIWFKLGEFDFMRVSLYDDDLVVE